MADSDPTSAERIDFAWKCHNAQQNWTAKVDTKASTVLTANLVGIAGLAAVVARQHVYNWRHIALAIAVGLACIGIMGVTASIFPILGPRRPMPVPDMVYFGQMFRRKPADVAVQLAGATTEEFLDQLSQQLVAMARLNWIKNRLLQLSLTFSIVAYVLAATAVVA